MGCQGWPGELSCYERNELLAKSAAFRRRASSKAKLVKLPLAWMGKIIQAISFFIQKKIELFSRIRREIIGI